MNRLPSGPFINDRDIGAAAARLSFHSFADDFLRGATDALARNELQLAVILSQTACELLTEQALALLLQFTGAAHLVNPILNNLSRPSRTLDSESVRDIYTALTGDSPSKAQWWQRWKESRKLRHRVVHEGTVPSSEDAQQCIDVARLYITHVEGRLRSVALSAVMQSGCAGDDYDEG